MAKPELIARQSRLPSGWLGEIVARLMAFETEPANRIAVQELAVQPEERVLEVGCGHGRTLARLAGAGCAFLAGIDPSEVMVRLARRRMRRWIDSGQADVSLAASAKIPHADGRFDAVFGVHVVYFWSEPTADLREIRRVLRPGGRVLLGYRPRDAETLAALPASVYALRSVDETERLLADSGFVEIRSAEHAIGRARFVCTHARRPAPAPGPG
ncbi:MAG: class I SAM-dependent methyltransferase [Deltaproteobacteria bacterium]|nr:class I SAM-dependent methyltransferase [Deltaproteobacteria bacterium]